MSLRGFIGAIIGGSFGFAQFFWLVYLDAENPNSHVPVGDFWFGIFAFTWLVEMVALVAIGMYRIAPWVTHFLRDDFETYWILKEKKQHYSIIVLISSLAVLVRAIARAIDTGSFTQSVGLGLLFASLPFILPHPKSRMKPKTASARVGATTG